MYKSTKCGVMTLLQKHLAVYVPGISCGQQAWVESMEAPSDVTLGSSWIHCSHLNDRNLLRA